MHIHMPYTNIISDLYLSMMNHNLRVMKDIWHSNTLQGTNMSHLGVNGNMNHHQKCLGRGFVAF